MIKYLLVFMVAVLVLSVVAFGFNRGEKALTGFDASYWMPIAVYHHNGHKSFIYFEWELEKITITGNTSLEMFDD